MAAGDHDDSINSSSIVTTDEDCSGEGGAVADDIYDTKVAYWTGK